MEDKKFMPEQIKKGVRIIPEIIEKGKGGKVVKGDDGAIQGPWHKNGRVIAEKWFEKLKSGEHAAKELSVVADNGGCGAHKCPKCGGPHCFSGIFPPDWARVM